MNTVDIDNTGQEKRPQAHIRPNTDGRFSTLRDQLMGVLAPRDALDLDVSQSATVNAQFWMSRFPIRPTAGWIVLAALLALGVVEQFSALDWKMLVLLWLLVDPLWGAIWRFAAGRVGALQVEQNISDEELHLPYMQPGSPADMLLGGTHSSALRVVFRVAAPTIVLAYIVAAVLGLIAVWWTTIFIGVTTIAWLMRQSFGNKPAALHSLATIMMPWFLSLAMLGVTTQSELWRTLALLAFFWFLHNWGEDRLLRMSRPNDPDKIGAGLLALAEVGIAILLISTREPLWLAVLVVLWLPTWLAIFQQRVTVNLRFWWLLAILASAMAVGQTMM